MAHDRIHARKPTHHLEEWETATIEAVSERDGHWVVTVQPDGGPTLELRTTFAIRDLVTRRLDIGPGESPVGERIWYKKRGGN